MTDKDLDLGNVADILAIDDLGTDVVNVPEWNCSVHVKALSKRKQMDLRKAATIKGVLDANRFEAFLFVAGVVKPEFKAEHIDQLLEKSAGGFDRVTSAILKISGMLPEAVEEVKAEFPE
jgi:hypothetical protein